MKIRECIVMAAILLLATPFAVMAESSSSSFILWADTQAGGGDRSTSASFINYGTAADVSGNTASSANFKLFGGFEQLYEEAKMTMSISGTNITFSPNPITTSGVSTGTSTITVSTNADFGYALTARLASGFKTSLGYQLANVADGAVTAGVEEFGVGLTGVDRAFTDDRLISAINSTVIASRSIWGAEITTTIRYKVAISPTSNAGDYSGSVIFIATGTF